MSDFYIAAEASIPYELVGPSGARAVLNDPSDSDFVGYLDGEDAITGIDSPEVRDSFAELAGRDGALSGVNYYSRRPIVMNGKVFPTSASDRNTKLGKLMAATDAMRADGTLSWTPSGGEPVFLKFRRQLPFRAKGGFNKDFQLGLVCADPRIYSQKAYMRLSETAGNSRVEDYRRFTYAASTGTGIATRSLYLPPGTYTISAPVRARFNGNSFFWTATGNSGATGVIGLSTNWQICSRTVTLTNAETVASTLAANTGSQITSGQYIELGDVMITSADGNFMSDTASFASNWSSTSGTTGEFRTASPPAISLISHPGNAVAYPRLRMIGPGTDFAYQIYGSVYSSQQRLQTSYSSSDFVVIDSGNRTVVKNGSGSDYASLSSAQSDWRGIAPDAAYSARLRGFSGATGATRAELTWRGVWL